MYWCMAVWKVLLASDVLCKGREGRLTVGLGGPAGEVGGVESELRLQLLDGVRVLEEKNLDSNLH